MKKKKRFELPYLGVVERAGMDLLYGESGEYSVLIKISNPAMRYCADGSIYESFHHLLLNIIKILGEGFILQKQDIFSKLSYAPIQTSEYLQQSYHEHFSSREYLQVETYLIITRQIKKGAFYVYDAKAALDYSQRVRKVMDLLAQNHLSAQLLRSFEIDGYVKKVLSMDFASDYRSLENFSSSDDHLSLGERAVKTLSLIDIDAMDLPRELSTFQSKSDGKAFRGFPQDNLSFFFEVPQVECMIYNQLIEIPAQSLTLSKLSLKRKRHAGIPDPANQMCAEDIDALLSEVARDNQLLVHAHFSISFACKKSELSKVSGYIESALFQIGIICSKNAYNQFELFRACLPGNGGSLKHYDWVLLTCEAAICLIFKERNQGSEDSDFLIRFTDRQGIPIGIDPSDLPMRSGRIANRSKFVLGGSGSGKSFFMNALIEQYLSYNMDVVIVDTGHSYSGLCAYFQGKYLSYSEQSPITMNPFFISEEEYNIEKRDFLKTLIALLFKGVDGEISQIEDTVISSVISSYYADCFLAHSSSPLSFDGFYHYSLDKIAQIKAAERISFDLDEYRYVLKKFCLNEEFGSLLNESSDASLFSQRLIIFEIDAIREHKVLFPIVTLIIMDVFLQKMRHRSHQRKALILEEAWKAIASPLMAGYLVYMYKTVRKFWGEAIVVTQELGDIIGNAIVKDSIISNSDTICLLDQGKFKENYEQVSSLLSLSEVEQHKIFTINQLDNKQNRSRFKEVYIRRGLIGEVYGVEVSLRQYLTFSTEKPEKRAIEHYIAQHGSYRKGLDSFINELNSSGKSLEEFIQGVNESIN